jgi:hypothetical protein
MPANLGIHEKASLFGHASSISNSSETHSGRGAGVSRDWRQMGKTVLQFSQIQSERTCQVKCFQDASASFACYETSIEAISDEG